MSVEDPVTRLTIRYKHLNQTLKFSDLSQISVPEKAFETFVNEISAAFWVIRELRKLSDDAISKDERQKAEDLQRQGMHMIAESYYSNRNYALECAYAREDALRNPDLNLANNIESKILFEECMGPIVRELGAPIASISGYVEMIKVYSLQQDRKREIFAIIDKQVEGILNVMSLCRRHLRGEINMWEYSYEEIQQLLK